MEISSCNDDLKELLFFYILAIMAEVFLCTAVFWKVIAITACVMLDIILSIDYLINWLYLSRKIILDEFGCTYVTNRGSKKFAWKDIYMQHVANASFLFGDSELSGEGVILSTKPISKPAHIGAMTYCRFTNPRTSVFIRFESSYDNLKRTVAKFTYQGFTANKCDFLLFVSAVDNLPKWNNLHET